MRALRIVPLLLALSGCGRSAPFSDGAAPSPTSEPTPGGPAVQDPRIENASLWEELEADPSQERVDELWDAIAAQGGSPLRESGRLIFVLRDAGSGWSVAGTFNAWDADATPLVRIPGTDTLAAEVSVATHSRHEYKLVQGDVWSRDPAARWVTWDGIETGTVGAFNSVAFAGESAPLGPSVVHMRAGFASDELDNERDVFVQVPSSYFPERDPLPLLVMHDGNESLTRGRFDAALDDARLAGDVPPVLVAYVALASQADRMDEYTFGTPGSRGDLYAAFIADELVPSLEKDFATPDDADSRGVIGASLGGLISYRIGFDRPDVFGRTGGQSSSFFWNDDQILGEMAAAQSLPGKWYLDAGEDADNGEVTAEMRDVLQSKGAEYEYVRDPTAKHEWQDWSERIAGAAAFLFD